ncbi:RNA polymerase Rpb4 [Rostrohypoxylon terebratum]|nr:RNA polymerase Rpb4 [Rostrohypoxylon terebratum]
MSHHPPTSRSRPEPPGAEEATTVLKLGEFQDVDTLTLSETALVINAIVAKRRIERKNVNETEMLTKTIDYLDTFARFKKKESVEAVERLLGSYPKLAKFERAQLGMHISTTRHGIRMDYSVRLIYSPRILGSLCCETAEEAKYLIPSLQNKISDEELQELLDEIYKLMPH